MNTNTTVTLTLPSNFDLARLGLRDVAYVRPIMVDGKKAYSVHCADGREIGLVTNMVEAVEAAHSLDLTPIPVH